MPNKFQILVWDEEPFFVAKCLDLNLARLGKTPDEAIDRLNDFLLSFLDGQENEIEKKNYELHDLVLPLYRVRR